MFFSVQLSIPIKNFALPSYLLNHENVDGFRILAFGPGIIKDLAKSHRPQQLWKAFATQLFSYG
jgi:hypothetical protein